MKVLVIDDEHDKVLPILNGLARRKKKNGWQYYYPEQSNVEDIVKTIEEELDFQPSVVILDLMMAKTAEGDDSHLGGIDILNMITKNEIKNVPSNIQIVILSAYDKMDDVRSQYGNRVFKIISKPCDFNEVFETLEEVEKL